MNKQLRLWKHVGKLLANYFLCFCVLFVGSGFLRSSSLGLADLTCYQGRVAHVALEGRSRRHFVLTMQGLPFKLETFYADQNYGALMAAIAPGDSVTAYFVSPRTRDALHAVAESTNSRVACELFQLTKRGEAIISIANKRRKEYWLSALLLTAGIAGIFWSTWAFRRGTL